MNRTGYTRAQTLTVLTGASVMLTLSMGMRQSFGLFVTPATEDIGVTVADFTLALAVQNWSGGSASLSSAASPTASAAGR